ncbi:MAG: metal-dependent hydrolase [Candidatus Aenigmarchaeota archaeon]|nr:metal-dependent hydrolase [Candidatus Aenigmarchaeota archaeon]
MQKVTHLIFAFFVLTIFGFVLNFPIYMSLVAFVGVLIPDIDIKFKKFHRKVFHNIWFLIILLFLGFRFFFFDQLTAIVFSIGFLSHLMADSLTHRGIMPLWPLEKPKFNGPVRTGGFGEYLIILIMLVLIYCAGSII